jgi:hypothetical protein
MQRLWNPLELALPPILELEAGASDEITRRRGHEHLARTGAAGNPRANMNRDAARLVAAATLDLPGMHPRTQVKAEST